MFVKSLVFASSRYPFCLKKTTTKKTKKKSGTILTGEVDVYLSPNLYNNNKPFLKNINETGEVANDSNALSYIMSQLRDPT